MSFLDWLVATDAPTVKVVKERRGREKFREKKRRVETQNRRQRSTNPRRR